MHEGRDDADLLLVALGQAADLTRQVQAEPVGKVVDVAGGHPSPETREGACLLYTSDAADEL